MFVHLALVFAEAMAQVLVLLLVAVLVVAYAFALARVLGVAQAEAVMLVVAEAMASLVCADWLRKRMTLSGDVAGFDLLCCETVVAVFFPDGLSQQRQQQLLPALAAVLAI